MKPTSLLCLNLPEMATAIVGHRLTPDVPKGAAIGQLKTGEWATSSLKEYPPAMNRVLAQQFFSFLCQVPCADCTDMDAAFLATCKEMSVTAFGDTVGRDYAG